MRRYGILIGVAALVLGLVASTALVQEQQDRENARTRERARAQRARTVRRGGAGGLLRDLTAGIRDLTPEQKRQVAGIRQAALAKVRQIERQMNEDIKKVLTPEQVKAMEAAQQQAARRGRGGITLTDEQRKIITDARAEAQKADGPEARREIMRAAYEKVRATYTEQQKKQAEQARTRMRQRQGNRRRQGQGQGGNTQGD